MTIAQPGFQFSHPVYFGSQFVVSRRYPVITQPAFEIMHRTLYQTEQSTNYKRNRATSLPAFVFRLDIAMADRMIRVPPTQKTFSQAFLIEVIALPGLPGDNTIELSYNIPGRLRVRPHLIAPPNGSQHRTGDPVMIWTPTIEAAYYEVHVARDIEFRDRVARLDVVGSSTQYGWPFGGVYYWKVRAVAGFAYSDYSEVWRFSVPSLTPAPVERHPQDAASLLLNQFREDT